MDKNITICAKCEWFIREGRIWHEQYCGAVDVMLPEGTNFVTGQHGLGVTSFGGRPQPGPYARDINRTGHCEHFITKMSLRERIFGRKANPCQT